VSSPPASGGTIVFMGTDGYDDPGPSCRSPRIAAGIMIKFVNPRLPDEIL
jgi:hypothetical protein